MDPAMNWQVLILNFYGEEKKVAALQETIQIKDKGGERLTWCEWTKLKKKVAAIWVNCKHWLKILHKKFS